MAGALEKLAAVQQRLRLMFGLDTRSMALFRIALGLCIIGDILNRGDDLHAHYTDAGVLARHHVLARFSNPYWINVHMVNGTFEFQFFLFAVHAMFAFSFLIGYYTKTSTLVTWWLTNSLQGRLLFLNHGGDQLLHQLLFFSFFLPLGSTFSLDAALFQKRRRRSASSVHAQSHLVSNCCTAAMIAQVAFLYGFSYWHKTGVEWHKLHTATFLALQLDYFRTSLGSFFLQFPETLKLLTAVVLEWEGWGVLLYVSPFFTEPCRMLGAVGFFGMHLAFALCLRLGTFAPIGMAANLLLIPGWVWDRFIFKRLHNADRAAFKVFYRPTCDMCTNVVRVLSTFALLPDTEFLAAEGWSPAKHTQQRQPESAGPTDGRDDSFVVDLTAHQVHRKSRAVHPAYAWLSVQTADGVIHSDHDAFIAVCEISPLLWPLAPLMRTRAMRLLGEVPAALHNHDEENARGGPAADAVAVAPFYTQKSTFRKHELKMGKRVFKVLWRGLVNATALFFILYCASWCAGNIGLTKWTTPGSLRFISAIFHLDQNWSMFAPHPPTVHWYYIIEAEQDDGQAFELWRKQGLFRWEGNPMSFEKPGDYDMHKSFKNHRWFKYFENGINTAGENQLLRLEFGRYICREYNARHFNSQRIYKFKLWWVNEAINMPAGDRTQQPSQQLWSHMCYDKPPPSPPVAA